jgi:hypothetical protein
MESPSLADTCDLAKERWGEGVPPNPAVLHAAAVGIISSWYRNTEAVQYFARANGPWHDVDMLRNNARATAICLVALRTIAASPDDEHVFEPELHWMFQRLVTLLPNRASRYSLWREQGNAAAVAWERITTNGLGNWLASLLHVFNYPDHWWGAPGYGHAIVPRYCALTPGPPDPDSFRSRMLTCPWMLTDEQAEFVCDYRDDVGPYDLSDQRLQTVLEAPYVEPDLRTAYRVERAQCWYCQRPIERLERNADDPKGWFHTDDLCSRGCRVATHDAEDGWTGLNDDGGFAWSAWNNSIARHWAAKPDPDTIHVAADL